MSKFLNSPITLILFFLLLIVVSILVLNVAFLPTMNRVEWREETYRVQTGDSLWAISGEYCPDGVDRREWIHEVEELNGIDNSIIHPGQKLTVLSPIK